MFNLTQPTEPSSDTPPQCEFAPNKFEYLVGGLERGFPGGEQEKLNQLGNEGWELVAVILDKTITGTVTKFYLKRLVH